MRIQGDGHALVVDTMEWNCTGGIKRQDCTAEGYKRMGMHLWEEERGWHALVLGVGRDGNALVGDTKGWQCIGSGTSFFL